MQRTVRLAVATGAAVFATALPQAASHNHAPGTSPGCFVAIEHKKHPPT